MGRLFTTIFLVLASLSVQGQSALWNGYVQSALDSTAPILRDYSYVGYHKSEIGLPEVSAATHTVFDITDYGAIPNDGLSDRQAIVDAIAAASHATPAIVYIPEGKFRINEPSDIGKPDIVVQADSLIIKGAGISKTELYADHSVLDQGSAVIFFSSQRPNRYYFTGAPVRANVVDVPEQHGGFEVEVDQAGQLAPGMVVAIVADLNVNTPEGQNYFLPHQVPNGAILNNESFNKGLSELHTIKSIQGNTVIFEEPIHMDLHFMENIVLKELAYFLRESGIEDLTLSGNNREQFKHHAGSTHSTKCNLLRFDYAYNCRANNIRFKDFSTAVTVVHSMYCTLANMSYEGNTGHLSSGVGRSYGILYAFQRENLPCHHGFGAQEHASNTVYYRGKQYQGLEAHGPFPRATLYDLNRGGFNTRGGGAQEYPSHGKGLCFWNWEVEIPGTEDFWPEGELYGYYMPPVIAGLHGATMDIDNMEVDLEAYESMGSKILAPESLFEAQLAYRIGSVPAWFTEQAALYEEISRPFWVQIQTPLNHAIYASGEEIKVKMVRDEELVLNSITKVELLLGDSLFQNGLSTVSLVEEWVPELRTRIYEEGTHIMRVRLTNIRGEVTESSPVSVYIRDNKRLVKHPVLRATSMTHFERVPLYQQLVAQGGGEAQYIANSAFNGHDLLELYEIEEQYRQQLDSFTEVFSNTYVKPVLDAPLAIDRAMALIDADVSTTLPNAFSPISSFVQFDLGESKYIDAIDFGFTSPPPDVQLEVLVSNDDRSWYTLVNDEMSWEFGVSRLGKNLIFEPLPNGMKARIFIPKRYARYIRLIMGNFPNDQLHTVTILGKAPPSDGFVHQIPGKIEAEAYHSQQGVSIELTKDSLLGRHLTSLDAGDATTYNVFVAETGVYNFSFRMTSDSVPGTLVCYLDGDSLTSIVNSMGLAERTWTTYHVSQPLSEGPHVVRLEFRGEPGQQLFDLNYFVVLRNTDADGESEVHIFPNPTSFFVSISESSPWELYSFTGAFLASGNGETVNLRDRKPGVYLLRVRNQVFKVLKF